MLHGLSLLCSLLSVVALSNFRCIVRRLDFHYCRWTISDMACGDMAAFPKNCLRSSNWKLLGAARLIQALQHIASLRVDGRLWLLIYWSRVPSQTDSMSDSIVHETSLKCHWRWFCWETRIIVCRGIH